MAGELEGCQWRRSSKVELFALGFWFWLGELGWGKGKGARLAGLATVGVGVGSGGFGGASHQAATPACHLRSGAAGFDRKLAMAEPAVVQPATAVEHAAGEIAVQAVEDDVKEAPEPEAEEDVDALLAQHQDLVDSMLAEVMLMPCLLCTSLFVGCDLGLVRSG